MRSITVVTVEQRSEDGDRDSEGAREAGSPSHQTDTSSGAMGLAGDESASDVFFLTAPGAGQPGEPTVTQGPALSRLIIELTVPGIM
eukprot:766055-Hanusia_phi.AAC.8